MERSISQANPAPASRHSRTTHNPSDAVPSLSNNDSPPQPNTLNNDPHLPAPPPPAPMHTTAPSSSNPLFSALESYPWLEDDDFQAGLAAILGNSPASPEQALELALRAKCFYYARKYNVEIDYDAYAAWRWGLRRGTAAAASAGGGGGGGAGGGRGSSRNGRRHDSDTAVDDVVGIEIDAPRAAAPGSGPAQLSSRHRPAPSSIATTTPMAPAVTAPTMPPPPAPSESESEPESHSSAPNPAATPSSADPKTPYPASFMQIVDLITNGKPVPGVVDVPDTVLEGRGSESVAAARRKPWERTGGGGGVGFEGPRPGDVGVDVGRVA